MKKTIIIIVLTILSSTLMAQNKSPKQHVFYYTVKTVRERVEYAPDTIPVYFKEVIINRDVTDDEQCYEHIVKGYVVWQTYRKPMTFYSGAVFSDSTFIYKQPEYYKDPYEPSKSIPGTFLYADKTNCKNLVIYSIKR